MLEHHRLRLIQLHTAIVLFGLTGLFGKYLRISPLMIVCGRSIFASIALGIYLVLAGKFSARSIRAGSPLVIVSGLILGFHWVSFFHCVQLSTVAVGVVTYSTSPVFSTLIEPWFFNEPWKPLSFIPAVLVMLGVICLAPVTNFENHILLGACWGTASGLAFAIYTLLNRLQVRGQSPQMLSFSQNLVVAIALLLTMPFFGSHFSPRDIAFTATLGILCTAIAQSLYIASLKGISAQLACIVSTLEAPYGIVFALILLHEIPPGRTILGGSIILAAAAIATWMQQRNSLPMIETALGGSEPAPVLRNPE